MNYCDILKQLSNKEETVQTQWYSVDSIPLRTQDFHHKLVESTQHALWMAIPRIFREIGKGLGQKTLSLWFQNYGNAIPPGPVKQKRVTASNRSYTPSFHSEEPAQSDFHPCHRSKKDWNSSVQTTATKIYMLVSLLTTGRHVLSLSRISRR